MKPWVKKALAWGFLASAFAYGVWNHGLIKSLDNALYAVTFYYIVVGLFGFVGWLARYILIKRFQKKNPGLFYLILLREKFGELR